MTEAATIIAATIVALGTVIATSWRMSGRVARSEASSLWVESSNIRDYLSKRIDELEKRLDDLEKERVTLRHENDDLRSRNARLAESCDRLRTENARLETENKSLKNTIMEALGSDAIE